MRRLYLTLAPLFMMLIGITLIEAGITAEFAEAKSFKGGRTFKMSPKKSPTSTAKQAPSQQKSGGGFSRGLMGGLLGGAIGGMLFGSMFGAGGTGMGILPILLLGVGAYFLFKRFSGASRGAPGYQGQREGTPPQGGGGMFGGAVNSGQPPPPPTPDIGGNLVDEGAAQIQATDRNFDPAYFTEIASDVFFQVQAGWMRRDLDSYRHLLGEQLAKEYEGHFEEMRNKGHINKLESIAIRSVEITQMGSDGKEDFVTVLFTANLLDYTVDDKTGDLVDGSMTDPVKFKEEWTWARPVGTEDWRLEGIH